MSCGATAARSGGSTPEASLRARSSAAANSPMRLSALVIFCHAAVVVTSATQASGTRVTSA